MSESHTAPVIGVEGLEVSFGGVRALRGVSLDLKAGEIVGLLGGNGAGKSTLMKCLTGVVQPDAGRILMDGEPVRFTQPSHAIQAGVRVVYQELSLFPALSVAENIVGPNSLGRWVRWRAIDRIAREALASVGIEMDVHRPVRQLSIGEQQIVEIVRAVRSGGRILILDEPTSALGPAQARRLFELMHALAGDGMAIVFVTQDFGDAQRQADVIRIMREGRISLPLRAASASSSKLIHEAFGADRDILEATYESGHQTLPAPPTTPVVLRVDRVTCAPMVADMSLSVHRGEVLGLFGTLDSGHLAFAEAVFGSRTRSGGEVMVSDRAVQPNSPRASVRAGMGYVSADRREALALAHKVADNITLANLGKMSRWFIPASAERRVSTDMIASLRIKSATASASVNSLSGGNQQKVLFARWILFRPEVLMLVEPTRGMDIAAKSDVIRIIQDLAASGTTIVVVSAEPEIVLSVSHRIAIARKGEIVHEFVDEDVSVLALLKAAA